MKRFVIAALAATALAGGPLRVHAQEKPFTALSRTLLAGRDSLVQLAREQVGLRYRWGAVRPGLAFDCSGLVKWLLSTFDLTMPRTAAQQARVGVAVPKDTAQLLPGDLLFFGHGRRISHIGFYVGEGNFVHAANRRMGVIESDITQVSPLWWKGARRIPLEADSSSSGVRNQESGVRGQGPGGPT